MKLYFTYNNSSSTTTDFTPFFANKGYHLSITVYPKCNLASTKIQDLVVNLDKLHKELCEAITEAQQHYQVQADWK